MRAVRPGTQVLGLFADSHMSYMAQRPANSLEPSLSEMTEKAIELLSASEKGFFLMIEGGRIDHAHHDGRAGYALAETQEFSKAVASAISKVDLRETLVLVTADHSHTLTIGGYPVRGNPILGLVTQNGEKGNQQTSVTFAEDGEPFTTLGYINGPGALNTLPRTTPEVGIHSIQQSLYASAWRNIDGSESIAETHGGEDVALFGIGPSSNLVAGVIEQDRIFEIMINAFGWSEEELSLRPIQQ
jgi:alkaline phosphatase